VIECRCMHGAGHKVLGKWFFCWLCPFGISLYLADDDTRIISSFSNFFALLPGRKGFSSMRGSADHTCQVINVSETTLVMRNPGFTLKTWHRRTTLRAALPLSWCRLSRGILNAIMFAV